MPFDAFFDASRKAFGPDTVTRLYFESVSIILRKVGSAGGYLV